VALAEAAAPLSGASYPQLHTSNIEHQMTNAELAARLEDVRTYTAQELGGHLFVSPRGDRKSTDSILVSVETRDAIIAALRAK
jgi:hypothetical protein